MFWSIEKDPNLNNYLNTKNVPSDVKRGRFLFACFARISKGRSSKRANPTLKYKRVTRASHSLFGNAFLKTNLFWEKYFWPSRSNRCESNESNRKKSCCTRICWQTLCKGRGPPLIKALLLSLSHLGIYLTHQTIWLTAIEICKETRVFPKLNLLTNYSRLVLCMQNYYAVHWETGHCKCMSRKTIAFWAIKSH